MKKYLILSLLMLAFATAAEGATDYYLKLGGVEGETTRATTSTGTGAVRVPIDEQEASVDYLIKIPPIDGESSKGKVEMEWKVEKGEKSNAIEPDEIDVADDGEPITPDFGILLGGGGENKNEELTEDEREKVAEILKEGAEEEGLTTEQISLNFEKIKVKVSQEVKLLGFIPLSTDATVEIDEKNAVKVKFPWWAFLASGKEDKEELGTRVYTTLSNVLKTKHDTVKNSIGNVR